MNTIVGIDASRNRSGGAKAHLLGILSGADPRNYGIFKVHVWAYQELTDCIPEYPWLVKHSPPALGKSLFRQVWWQYRHLPGEARAHSCDLLFNTDAGSICPFRPCVTLSQDMLSFEPREMKRFGFSLALLRLVLLRYIQMRSLQAAGGVVFLTDYAARVIQKSTGPIANYRIIPHGIGRAFRRPPPHPGATTRHHVEFRCLYVSNAAMYKHQWTVVEAVAKIRQEGFNATLHLVGGGGGRAQTLTERAISTYDSQGGFVIQDPYVDHARIPDYLSAADAFIFASSCENMPITLLEAMASGLPIACSNRGPMPEILRDGGVYFDPENGESIAAAIRDLADNKERQQQLATKAWTISGRYTWERCAAATWDFLAACAADARCTAPEPIR